jgi:hypothetical protein
VTGWGVEGGGGERKTEGERGRLRERHWCEDAVLLSLKMKEGAIN